MLKRIITLIFGILILSPINARTESRIYKEASVNSYFSSYKDSTKRLGRVKENACRQGWFSSDGYRIYIISNPEPNAISYPNQIILINSGLMNAVRSDEELELILWLLVIESSC